MPWEYSFYYVWKNLLWLIYQNLDNKLISTNFELWKKIVSEMICCSDNLGFQEIPSLLVVWGSIPLRKWSHESKLLEN